MIAREFPIIRSSQICKRGPVKNPFAVRKKYNRKKRPALRDHDQRERVDIEQEHDGETEQNKEMTLHIPGQSTPIFIKVIRNLSDDENKGMEDSTDN